MSMTNTETIQSLIDSGEGYNVEFKVRVPSKVRELTEEICAFANADGGYLLIGVDDNGQIIGTGLENDKRSAIQTHRNFVLSKKCAVSFRNATKYFLMLSLVRGSTFTQMQMNKR